jgi:hypothetical protein
MQMTHIIMAPEEIENPLYEGQLAFTPATIEEAARQKGGESVRRELKSAGPVVTLGQPQCWNLASLARERGDALPAEIALPLRDADFYLLQLACSLRPERDSEVTWVRLNVYLRPKTGQEAPIAFDLYPREIYDEVKTDWKVNIAPSLKFAVFEGVEVEGKLGEVITTIEFRRLEPVVVGYGLQQSDPGWDFEKHREHPLRGVKSSYLIVKKPHGAEAVRMTLDIAADVVTQHGLLSARVTEEDRSHLSLVVCTD